MNKLLIKISSRRGKFEMTYLDKDMQTEYEKTVYTFNFFKKKGFYKKIFLEKVLVSLPMMSGDGYTKIRVSGDWTSYIGYIDYI